MSRLCAPAAATSTALRTRTDPLLQKNPIRREFGELSRAESVPGLILSPRARIALPQTGWLHRGQLPHPPLRLRQHFDAEQSDVLGAVYALPMRPPT
jgi:hypothetical protein